MAHSPETMRRARILYEGSRLLLKQISYELNIGKRTLDRWARQYQWRPRCRIKGEHHERYITREIQL